jgi:hypothetical protein
MKAWEYRREYYVRCESAPVRLYAEEYEVDKALALYKYADMGFGTVPFTYLEHAEGQGKHILKTESLSIEYLHDKIRSVHSKSGATDHGETKVIPNAGLATDKCNHCSDYHANCNRTYRGTGIQPVRQVAGAK